jgi:hypothetical protein
VDTIDEAMAVADRAWRAYGVRRADRTALAADLRLDLQAAAADGVSPARLIGTDVPGFARRLADESGVRREPPDLVRLLGTALVGAALGTTAALVVLAVLEEVAQGFLGPPSDSVVPVQVTVVAYYSLPAVLVVAGAVLTVRFRLRELGHIRETAHAMALLLPLAGILVTPVTMAFAWTTGYSTSALPMLIEVSLVAGALAGATVLARRWALREPKEQATAAAT